MSPKYPTLWSAAVEERVCREAMNLDMQQRSPYPVQRCTRCVMTNQRPRITFDVDGVCSACRYKEHKDKHVDWAFRAKKLANVLASSKRGGLYDVIVPASGGKDSAFVAYTLRQMGMTPLLARWAPNMTTEIGEQNWQALLHSGFDGVTAQPNGLTHRKLCRLALEFYGDPFIPFIWGQLAWPMHVALQNNVETVFFGENGEAEYGGDCAAAERPFWEHAEWKRVYLKGATFFDLAELGRSLGALSANEIKCASPFYVLPLRKCFPKFHWLGYYLYWRPQSNYYSAIDNCGFTPASERSEGTYSRYASLDDKLDGLHYWFGYLKFGIGRCTSDAAHEVRDGELTRTEALGLIERYDAEVPGRHLVECEDYLGMTHDRLWEVAERFKR